MSLKELFSHNKKKTHPYKEGQKVTNSNSPLKQRKERKCVIKLIPVKGYEKVLVFLVAKALKDATKSLSLKLEMMFHNSLFHLNPVSHFIPMLPNILDPSSFMKNLPPL